MDPAEKEVLNTLMAQVEALELVLKMVISVQLVDHVVVHAGDPKNQSAIDAVARAFRERVLETVSTAAAKFPDKKVANFVEGSPRKRSLAYTMTPQNRLAKRRRGISAEVRLRLTTSLEIRSVASASVGAPLAN